MRPRGPRIPATGPWVLGAGPGRSGVCPGVPGAGPREARGWCREARDRPQGARGLQPPRVGRKIPRTGRWVPRTPEAPRPPIWKVFWSVLALKPFKSEASEPLGPPTRGEAGSCRPTCHLSIRSPLLQLDRIVITVWLLILRFCSRFAHHSEPGPARTHPPPPAKVHVKST